MKKRDKKTKKIKKIKKTNKIIAYSISISVLFIIFTSIVAINLILREIPHLDRLLNINTDNKQVINLLYSDNLSSIKNYNVNDENEVNFNEISPNIINALIATEDKRFFKHKGIDIFGIIRAMFANLKERKLVQGGSTISQQLAKAILRDNSKTFLRKFKELILTMRIEKFLTKEEIITMYLNENYFGGGQTGIKNASAFYFNKLPSDLTIEESALLIGLLKAPSKFSPTNSEDLAKRRALQVIINMQNLGFVDAKDVFSYIIPDINYSYNEINRKTQKFYFTDWINKKLSLYNTFLENYSQISVITTMDSRIQNTVESVLYHFIETNKKQINKAQIAIIVMNNKGEILSMIGGKNYDKSSFNRSLYAYRQTGSLFKLFVYLTGLENGLQPDETFIDEPIAVQNWYPENYGKKYYGKVTAEEAFSKSLNSVAVQIAEYFGLNNIIDMAKRMGISSTFKKNDLTISLGTAETNLLEMVKAYTIINNGGIDIEVKPIKYILDSDNKIVFQAVNTNNKILQDSTIQYIKKMLYETIINGTGKNAKNEALIEKTETFNTINPNYPKYFIGGKTGSTQDARDAWFVGYANDLTIGIWFGNDDNTPTNNIMGGNLPAKLWGEIVENIF